jgi:hypothetical protein
MTNISINTLPLWGVFLLTVVMVLVAITCGYRAGTIRRKESEGAPEGPVGSVVGAVLGLLAFMLAFTFSMSAGRYDTRKQMLLDEVNAIGTAALRAQLLPEPHRAQCGDLLKQYVDIRVDIAADPRQMAEGLKASEAIQAQLWAHAMELARADMNSDIGALFVESLNTVIDLHTSRVTVALQYRIPTVIWSVLFALTILSMAGVGFQFGIIGRYSVAVNIILACSFALVVGLISDLDRATTGMLKVSQKPMVELQKKLSAPSNP